MMVLVVAVVVFFLGRLDPIVCSGSENAETLCAHCALHFPTLIILLCFFFDRFISMFVYIRNPQLVFYAVAAVAVAAATTISSRTTTTTTATASRTPATAGRTPTTATRSGGCRTPTLEIPPACTSALLKG